MVTGEIRLVVRFFPWAQGEVVGVERGKGMQAVRVVHREEAAERSHGCPGRGCRGVFLFLRLLSAPRGTW